jgi:SAM-dependent methyltransferase
LSTDQRTHALGETKPLGPVDRFGNWLSMRTLERHVGSPVGKRIADIGSGFEAVIGRRFGARAESVVAVDLALSPAVHATPNVTAIEGRLPEVMATLDDGTVDIALCVSVLEHLEEPATTLGELRRVLAPGGVLFVNVPSWRGKRFLEFSAFRLGLSPREEMDDHKTYYDPRDLWPMLVAAGFVPHAITCRRHKAGLNTFAVCKIES